MTVTKKINLALQGGGAHGAFTWGVLDAILEDRRLEIEAISGASAGAMNAVALADGYASGGRTGAQRQLKEFWHKASLDSGLAGMTRTAFDGLLAAWGFGKRPSEWLLDTMMQSASPYTFNPLNINPLRDILTEEIDFARLRTASPIRLYISATNVDNGKIRVFETQELTADHITASACLPLVFQTVVIDDIPYWDGGYMGNPALYPLFSCKSSDILLVQINPVERKGIPRTLDAIQNRLNEITFNASLLREMRAIDFVTRLIEEGTLNNPKYRRIFMHRIAMSDTVDESAASKMSAQWSYFQKLNKAGRKAGKAWIAANYDAIGGKSTMDLRQEFA
ncbi:MAG: patatin-like phospholipase family protein [Proteobacteria bacterium]|nr:patatin-like phospholipase family protein [Pseudomonadota bacterium]